jgi:hypothetical protein
VEAVITRPDMGKPSSRGSNGFGFNKIQKFVEVLEQLFNFCCQGIH